MTNPAGIGVVDRRAVVPRTFAWSGEPRRERLRWFAAGLREVMLDQGYTEVDAPGPDVAVVLHFVDPDAARPYRRKNAPTFVVALAELDDTPGDMLRTLRGLTRVAAVESDQGQPVFNLQVAANQDFFVGAAGTLAHDNSLVEPVPAPFDAAPSLASVVAREN